jgi:predicted N-formylglutamate amidohydrolase
MLPIIITCEHGGNKIPKPYGKLFKPFNKILESHQGFDEYALPIAMGLSQTLKSPLFYSETSRLLIDLNRSTDHEYLFSKITRELPLSTKKSIIETFYRPFRDQVSAEIQKLARKGKRIVHLSIHSFTPILNNKVRTCEIGLLFDPKRPFEARFAAALRPLLKKAFPDARIKMNYPYRGTADGHTTFIRKSLPDSKYAGIEIELNQKWVQPRARASKSAYTTCAIAEAIAQALINSQLRTGKKA